MTDRVKKIREDVEVSYTGHLLRQISGLKVLMEILPGGKEACK